MEKMQLASWTSFKNICIISKNLSCQYGIRPGGGYDLYGPEASAFMWKVSIIPGVNAADILDFETNYKAKFNAPVGVRASPVAASTFGADDDSFGGTFLKATTVPTITDLYYKFDHTTYVSGGEFWTAGAKRGDVVAVDLVDKDGVVVIPASLGGNGIATFPPGTVLMPYIRSRRLLPVDNTPLKIDRPYWSPPPVGSYLRFRGTISNTISDVMFDCNLSLHKPILS